MKRNQDYLLREIAGECIIVSTGAAAQNFNGMITVNSVGRFIFEHVEEAKDEKELLSMILDRYEIDEATADRDMKIFLQLMREKGMLE